MFNSNLIFVNSLVISLSQPFLSAELKEAWDTVIPDYTFDYTFYDEFFNSLYQKEEKQGLSVAIFAFLALIITLMGITGLTFQNCISRSKEIGIRKINGARVSEVMAILNMDFIKQVAVSFVLASVVSWYSMHLWLQTFAYKTGLNWWIFAVAGLATLTIVIITVSLQSWKAATRNPVEALRYE